MPELPDTPYSPLGPDWVCEVLSASTRKVDLQEKRPAYAREGVAHLWLIDPIDRTLEAFELRDGEWVLIACAAAGVATAEALGAASVDELELTASALGLETDGAPRWWRV